MYSIDRRLPILCLSVMLTTGCEVAKSANPLSPNVAGPIAGVSIQPPKPVEPAASAKISNDEQPITLTVDNASTNGVRQVNYIFEIAADSSFAIKVFAQAGVEPSPSGRTSLRVPDLLAPEHTYFWRAKADDGANASPYSPAVSFDVYTPVVIQAPVPREPASGAIVTSLRPAFVVANATSSGPLTGPLHYVFEVATDPAMTNRIDTQEVPETATQTTCMLTTDLVPATLYFWRVKAIDPPHAGPYSATQTFVTSAPAPGPPPPGPTPPGPPAPSAATDHINMSQATIWNSPTDLANWTISAGITRLDLTTNGVHIEVSPDKLNGPNRWPEASFGVQYTLGMCLNINGRWNCSAVVQFWTGLPASGGPPAEYAKNWFYDPSRWGPMSGHQPAPGEMIGFFACMGDCRNNTKGDLSPLKERTNVVLVPMPGSGGGSYRF